MRSDPARECDASIDELIGLMRRDLPASRLRTIWGSRTQAWHDRPDIHRLLATQLVDKGEPSLALEVISTALERRPGNGDTRRFDRNPTVPIVVISSGHMIDQPIRPQQRFPASSEARVAAEIRERLETLNAGFGYASAACGSDILFLEAMLERSGEIHVLLPQGLEEFRRTSVDFVEGWGGRFDRILSHAEQVLVVDPDAVATDVAGYECANLLRDGLAILHARCLDTEVAAVAVWDGKSGDGCGGTASAVDNWKRHQLSVDVISPLQAAPEGMHRGST